MRFVRAGSDTTPKIQTEIPREKEVTKNMARRKLTFEEQLRGVRAALRSKRTPPQLKQGLKRRAEWLGQQVGRASREKALK